MSTSSLVRPPFAYYGGKQRLASAIVSMLPPHTHYVEPFAGGLAVLLAKSPSRLETVNDNDGDLMHFWRVLRDHPAELTRACALTPHSRRELDAALCGPAAPAGADDGIERARQTWVRIAQGRTGTLRRTGWRFDSADFCRKSGIYPLRSGQGPVPEGVAARRYSFALSGVGVRVVGVVSNRTRRSVPW